MFAFSSLATQVFQGSVERTWNCVTQFTNLLWYKFNHYRYSVMPRSRRRHHSRSRSGSRSHSHDRDRDAKRRKIDNVDSPSSHKRSVSSEPETSVHHEEHGNQPKEQLDKSVEIPKVDNKITPKKTATPKTSQRKIESEKKRQQKQLEREEREKKRQEDKERKEQLRKEKEELKNKKIEQKAQEREEKEAKRKEREEREETRRKEREQEKLKKQQELEEKNREKKKIEEQKQKTAKAFVNFFVPKKTEVKLEDSKKMFMPFEVKTDMRLAPLKRRASLTDEEKAVLVEALKDCCQGVPYLKELKEGRKVGRNGRTWSYEDDDVVIVEEDFGESICEDKQKGQKMRVKFLKFHENKRPPYYGTWRKTSSTVKPRKPFAEDKTYFDYEVDSDDDWEEEEQGESLNGSDDEEKETEAENDDYEVDNEFFVPHGHLSDDEVDDEVSCKLSPESHKQKLKLLKDEFDQDMQTKTNKMKPRSIGCIWYKKDGSNIDESIDRHLRPLAMITNCSIIIKKRSNLLLINAKAKNAKELPQEHIGMFLKLIHGNFNKKATIVEEFINYMEKNGSPVEVSKAYLKRCLKQFAQWKKCSDEGPLFNKYCWYVEDDVKKTYSVDKF